MRIDKVIADINNIFLDFSFNKRLIKVILVFSITAGIFVLLFRKIEISEVTNIIKRANHTMLVLSIIISLFANVLVAAELWRKVTKVLGCSISFIESLLIRLSIAPIKGILPLKSGELFRALYLKRRYNFSLFLGTSSILMVLTLNLLTLAFAAIIGVTFLKISHPFLRYEYFTLPLLMLLTILLIILLIKNKIIQTKILCYFEKNFPKFYPKVNKFLSTYQAIGFRKLLIPLFYSTFITFSELVIFYLLLRSLNISVPIYSVLIFLPLVILIGNLPISLYGLGTREAAIILFFSGYAPSEALLSGGILYSFINYLLPPILGLSFTKFFFDSFFAKGKINSNAYPSA